MALSQPHRHLSKEITRTLKYFDKYDYPLTKAELEYWSGEIIRSPRKFYFLPDRIDLVKLRQKREKISQRKWQIAKEMGKKLKRFSAIAAVFVTGSLAMNNCTEDDDIDLMIVTYPNTLWTTRFLMNLYLRRVRRYPGQAQAPDKLCPNLWLDLNHLSILSHNLYHAHEVLQAKVLWDRANAHCQFLQRNFWVKDYLPNAYQFQINNLDHLDQLEIRNLLLWPLNLLFFLIQYLYMLPKMTNEKVGLGYAFFHPG